MKSALRLLVLVALGLLASQSAMADPVTLTVGKGGIAGDLIIGEVVPKLTGSSGGLEERNALMVNNLLAMTLGARTAEGVSPEYYRSTTDYGYLPEATTVGGTSGTGFADGGQYVQVTLQQRYLYLVGTWDGQNSGAQVWYVGGLAPGTVINIPRYAYPLPSSGNPPNPAAVWPQDLVDGYADSKYLMTSWTLLNPTPVPDGSTTVILLGLSLAGLGFAARYKQ